MPEQNVEKIQPSVETINPQKSSEKEKGFEKHEVESNTSQTSEESRNNSVLHQSASNISASEEQENYNELGTIENILAEGMDEFFLSLSSAKQIEFKIKGEKTAIKIREVVKTGKYRAKQIVDLIIEWLKGLPGINKFYMEQEAKIKADKIIDSFKK